MARIVADSLWLCVDCLMVAVNDDDSGMDPGRALAVREGIRALQTRLGGFLAADWGAGSGDGIDSFSWNACPCCLSTLGGERHRFAVIA